MEVVVLTFHASLDQASLHLPQVLSGHIAQPVYRHNIGNTCDLHFLTLVFIKCIPILTQ
jgi:hypothetical protein